MHMSQDPPGLDADGAPVGQTPAVEAERLRVRFLPWLGRACRQAREDRGVVQVKIAAAIEVNQATIARFEDG